MAPGGLPAQPGELPAVAPKEAGFSSERLAAPDVDDGALSGIVTLVTRHGNDRVLEQALITS